MLLFRVVVLDAQEIETLLDCMLLPDSAESPTGVRAKRVFPEYTILYLLRLYKKCRFYKSKIIKYGEIF